MSEQEKPVNKSSSGEPQQWNLLNHLLLSLIFVLFVVPLADRVPYAEALLRLGITAVLILAAVAIGSKWIRLASLLVIAAILSGTNWAAMFVETPWMIAVFCAAESIFLVAMAMAILAWILSNEVPTTHSVSGVIAAYLLLGLAWAMVYWGLDNLHSDMLIVGSGSAPKSTSSDKVAAFSQMTYFSFVTMSTLGYGDLVPQTPLTRTLAWMQSVAGQFYIAFLVAWIVSQISDKRSNER